MFLIGANHYYKEMDNTSLCTSKFLGLYVPKTKIRIRRQLSNYFSNLSHFWEFFWEIRE